MKNINQIICVVGLVLVMVICTTGNVVATGDNSEFFYSTNSTVESRACHRGRCHTTTTSIYGFDFLDDDLCDNLTVNYDVYNTTNWSNTTCTLLACLTDGEGVCGAVVLTYQSCTNGDCLNGTTEIDLCFDVNGKMNTLYNKNNLNDIFDIPCVHFLYYNYRRSRFNQRK